MSELEPTRTYSNPTATEVLRRMLDEREVEWRGGLPTETIVTDPIDVLYVQRTDGMIHVYIRSYLTPAQAIAATLGTGTCHEVMINRHWRGCSECGYVWENMYSAGFQIGPNYCPMCGAKVVD